MEVPRWLQLQERIDYLYFVLDQIRKQMPKSPIDALVDDATGFDAERRKEIREIVEEMKNLKHEWMKETESEVSTEMEDEILGLLK